MPMLSEKEAATIERGIAEVERCCGVQIVAALVPRSDDYPEVPWRAFALGCSVAALVALAIDVGRPDWMSTGALLAQALVILGVGAIAASATLIVPRFARLFVRASRSADEVRQRAEGMFLARELFATPGRDAVLVFVSLFERRVVVVPDAGYRNRVATADWQSVIDRMTPELAAGRSAEALSGGLRAIEDMLTAKGYKGGGVDNVLPDALVQGDAP